MPDMTRFDKMLAAYTQAVTKYGEAQAAWKQSDRYDAKHMSPDMAQVAREIEAIRIDLRALVSGGEE